jgi:excisionase family DNA binding protein
MTPDLIPLRADVEPLEGAMARTLDRMYRPEEIARQWGVGRSLIWRLMKDGALPYCHVGRFRRISGRAAAQFIEQRMADAAGREAS